jgi:hypothetical protein
MRSMTPEAVLTVAAVQCTGRWRGERIEAITDLVVTEEDVRAGHVVLPLRELTDATWGSDVLTLHGVSDTVAARGSRDLAHVWATITAKACTIPEVTHGLRALRAPALDTAAAAHTRIFGPLLAARKRLQTPESVERRVAQFDPVALEQRLHATLRELALERWPGDPPRRRALEAALEEAAHDLLRQLHVAEQRTREVHEIAEGSRFTAWRRWTTALRRVFVAADRSWPAMLKELDLR